MTSEKMDYKELIEQLRKHHQSWAAYSDLELAHDLEDAITAIETLLAERETAGWISVEERLPEAKQRVLTYSPVDGIAMGAHMGDGRWLVISSYPDTPTHWMPLPTPPDRQKEDKHD